MEFDPLDDERFSHSDISFILVKRAAMIRFFTHSPRCNSRLPDHRSSRPRLEALEERSALTVNLIGFRKQPI